MSRYKREQTAYDFQKKKYVPLWKLDTNTVTVTHFNADTQTEESKTYHTDFIRYHLHFSDSHCPDRLRKLVNESKIILYLDDMKLKVSEAISVMWSFGSRPIAVIRRLSSVVMPRRCSVLKTALLEWREK